MSSVPRLRDRAHAGSLLAPAVVRAAGDAGRTIVLAIPRGGVIVAVPVAMALGAPLDVVVPRKLGAPGQPELAIGAIAPGVRVLDDDLIARLGVGEAELDAAVARAESEIARRTAAYRADAPEPDLGEATVFLIDDGIATGATALAAAAWARRAGAARVVVVAPVAPEATGRRLRAAVDDLILLATPEPFIAVGQWYDRFDQVSDDEVRVALAAFR